MLQDSFFFTYFLFSFKYSLPFYKCCSTSIICCVSLYNLFDTYKFFIMVVCRIYSTCTHICSSSSYNLFGTYKCFVLLVCIICSTCIHICSVCSYNLFATYKYFFLAIIIILICSIYNNNNLFRLLF
jgi:hypothetical protein